MCTLLDTVAGPTNGEPACGTDAERYLHKFDPCILFRIRKPPAYKRKLGAPIRKVCSDFISTTVRGDEEDSMSSLAAPGVWQPA